MPSYRVQSADTPMSIAQRFTGDQFRARELVIANAQKEWATRSGMLTFQSLSPGEILTLPQSWGIQKNIGVGDAQQVTNALAPLTGNMDFPQEKLTLAARREIDKLTGSSENTKRLEDVYNVAANVASGSSISWDTFVNTAASVATLAGSPIAGGVIYAVGTAIGAFKDVLPDISSFLGGSTPIKSNPVDISMNCLVAKDLITTKRKPNPIIPYGFNDPAWMHIVDRNELKPGTETWDPRGIPGVGGPEVFTGTMWIYGESDFIRSCQFLPGKIVCNLPNYDNFQYRLAGRALLWMFGAVFNEITYINQRLNSNISTKDRTELEFRKFFFGLLLRNWESRINCNVNMNDRTLLYGAIGLWNEIHNDSETVTYYPIFPDPPGNYLIGAAEGYCRYEFNINGRVPERSNSPGACPSREDRGDWAVTDISWTRQRSFIDFMLTGTFDVVGRAAPITVNMGTKKNRSNLVSAQKFERLIEVNIHKSSTTSKIVTGTAITAAVAAGSLYVYSYVTKQTFLGAAKYLYGRAKNKTISTVKKGKKILSFREENPLALPPKHESTAIVPYRPLATVSPNNKNRRVAYRVDLGGDPYVETVRMLNDGSAVMYRHTRPISRFRPTQYQLAKIRAGQGSLLIYADQLLA